MPQNKDTQSLDAKFKREKELLEDDYDALVDQITANWGRRCEADPALAANQAEERTVRNEIARLQQKCRDEIKALRKRIYGEG